MKFWKNELVGRGAERRWGAKNVEGSGRTAEWVWGKTKGRSAAGGGGGDMGGDREGEGGGGGVGGGFLGDFFLLKGFVITVLTLRLIFFNMVGYLYNLGKIRG